MHFLKEDETKNFYKKLCFKNQALFDLEEGEEQNPVSV